MPEHPVRWQPNFSISALLFIFYPYLQSRITYVFWYHILYSKKYKDGRSLAQAKIWRLPYSRTRCMQNITSYSWKVVHGNHLGKKVLFMLIGILRFAKLTSAWHGICESKLSCSSSYSKSLIIRTPHWHTTTNTISTINTTSNYHMPFTDCPFFQLPMGLLGIQLLEETRVAIWLAENLVATNKRIQINTESIEPNRSYATSTSTIAIQLPLLQLALA